MDNNTGPCEDFYQYACGNWIHEHPMEGENLETSRFVESRISLSLEIRGNHQTSMYGNLLHSAYEGCPEERLNKLSTELFLVK